eukprot:7079580-Pyramimonas_sp.AAC.1
MQHGPTLSSLLSSRPLIGGHMLGIHVGHDRTDASDPGGPLFKKSSFGNPRSTDGLRHARSVTLPLSPPASKVIPSFTQRGGEASLETRTRAMRSHFDHAHALKALPLLYL